MAQRNPFEQCQGLKNVETAKPQPKIESELNQLDGDISRISSVLFELEKRLASVMTPQPVCNGTDTAKYPAPPFSVSERIRSARQEISQLGERMASVLGRLEV